MFEDKLRECDNQKNKEDIIACKFRLLHEITSIQDKININLMKTIDDDTDERWIPLSMIDNANAVILGISQNKGKPKLIIKEGYIKEKIEDLTQKWMILKLKSDI